MSRQEFEQNRVSLGSKSRFRQRALAVLLGAAFSVLAAGDLAFMSNGAQSLPNLALYFKLFSASIAVLAGLIGVTIGESVVPNDRGSRTAPKVKLRQPIQDVRAYCVDVQRHDVRLLWHLVSIAGVGVMLAILLLVLAVSGSSVLQASSTLEKVSLASIYIVVFVNALWLIVTGIVYTALRRRPRPDKVEKAGLVRVSPQ